jgi:hypothetical protein
MNYYDIAIVFFKLFAALLITSLVVGFIGAVVAVLFSAREGPKNGPR